MGSSTIRTCAAAALILTAVAIALSAQTRPLRVVPVVDYERYAGTWYEIARLPNSFEKKCVGDITATYTVRQDGRIDVKNRCRVANGAFSDAVGIARRVDGQPPSVLKVRFAPAFLSFIPLVWGDYQIIELADDYSHVIVGSPDREYLWILSRTPRMDDTLYRSLLKAAESQGFGTTGMVKVEQGQEGAPGAPARKKP
jgi:apolipoprotein D and lipocalin family protein